MGFPGGSDSSIMQETQIQSPGWEDPLEKGMAMHSNTLAWRFLWTKEPHGLQSFVVIRNVGYISSVVLHILVVYLLYI